MKNFILLIPLLLIIVGCQPAETLKNSKLSENNSPQNEFVCGRDKVKDADGNEYKTAYFDIDGGHDVNKKGQCWMVENLNVGKKILNPNENPSYDDVIEKWCMTDDKKAIRGKHHECFEGGLITPEKKKLNCNRGGSTANSDINHCNGTNNKPKCGGLYSFNEILKNNICPQGWKIPTQHDWQELMKMAQTKMKLQPWEKVERQYRDKALSDLWFEGFEKDKFGVNFHINFRREYYKKSLLNNLNSKGFCAEELKYGVFDAKLCGLKTNEEFREKGNQTCFAIIDKDPIIAGKACMQIKRGGDPFSEFYVYLKSGFSPYYDYSHGVSVRCIKSK